ncbi:MAG TPA: lytic transglycosylase domain-containing protein [Candidatus Cloacimonadota bacterium]|nr:lytic transglycosylase domain-containing protein [Candidatus Cloacimonadota bacterium]HPT70781.1 lytic transglycosylase domain-containing protein [Candidatus Cloacimonadota bacterium]
MKAFIIWFLFIILTIVILLYNPFTVRLIVIWQAHHYDLNAKYFYRLISQESTFRSLAISKQKALGPGQVREGTARYLDPNYRKGSLYFPYYNIRISAQYVRYLLNKYNHNWSLAIAAYNWGETNVDRKVVGMKIDRDANYRELFENVRETYNLLDKVLNSR